MEQGHHSPEPTGMVVGSPRDDTTDSAPRPDRGHGASRTDDRDASTARRWLVVGAVLTVAVIAAVVLGRTPPRPDVESIDWSTNELVTAEPAPDHSLAQRWSMDLPSDHELVGAAIIDRAVVVVSRSRRVRPDDDRVRVQSFDRHDGAGDWHRTVPGRDTIVAMGSGDDLTLVANAGQQADPVGRRAWGGTGLAVLDADGSTRWSRDLDRDTRVEVRSRGDLLVTGNRAVLLLDAVDGAVRLEWPTDTTEVDGNLLVRAAYWSGDAWVVPTRGGWEIADADGRVEFSHDDVDRWPSVHDDLVILSQGSVVTALHRPDGEQAWRVDVGRDVYGVDRVDGSDEDEPAGGRFLARVPAPITTDGNGNDEVVQMGGVRTEESVLIDDGVVVGPVPPDEYVSRNPNPRSRLVVDINGVRRVACRPAPAGMAVVDGAEPCPADLAVLDETGATLATATARAQPTPERHPATIWRVTDTGVLSFEDPHLRLRRWADLSQVWSIDTTGPWSRPPVVDTDATGVLVATLQHDSPRISWYG